MIVRLAGDGMQIVGCLARLCILRNSTKRVVTRSNKYSEPYSVPFAEYGDSIKNCEGPMVARAPTT